MRAALFHEFEGPIRVAEVADPAPPPDGVVLRVRANGVCRSDWHAWMGHDPDIKSLPHVPGHECAGVIEAVGPEVKRWRVGDRAILPVVSGCGRCGLCQGGQHQVCPEQFQPGFTAWGAFAEYVAAPYADANLVALPEAVSFAAGASLGCRFTTAWRVIVQQGRVSPGQWVVVYACGGVGLSAVMIAASLGAQVIAVDIDPAKLDLAKAVGARHLLDARSTNDLPAAVHDLTGGGAALSVDALGKPELCRDAILSLRRQGRHVQVGLLLGGDKAPPLPMDRVIAWELEVVGSHAMAGHSFGDMMALVASGTLDPERLIGAHVSLEEGARALERMDDFTDIGVTMIERF